jgi:CAAX prenyl protease-like protein
MLFRVHGSVITVPIAEELLFRGYLLSRLACHDINLEGRIFFHGSPWFCPRPCWVFTMLEWVAGIVAGLIFGLVRDRSDSIKDAVTAYACANLLLSVYVMSSGNWSFWECQQEFG